MLVSRPAQSAGTSPLNRNQAVPQAGPQAVPIGAGAYDAASASAGGTGSPGACQISARSGTASPYTAGLIRSIKARLQPFLDELSVVVHGILRLSADRASTDNAVTCSQGRPEPVLAKGRVGGDRA